MSTRDSGYGESWNRTRNRAMAQPDSANIPFSPSDMNKQSQPLQSDQFSFPVHHSYRETCGTSVSAIESQPDYFTHTPLDEVPDQDFNPNPPPGADELAGLLQAPLFDMDPLNPDSACVPMTPYTSRYPEPPQSDSELYSSLLSNDQLWSEFRNLQRDDNMMPNQSPTYDRTSTNKRRRLMSDSGIGTQQSSPSSAFNPSQNRLRSHPTQNSQFLYPHTAASTQQGDTTSVYSQQQQQGADSFSERRHTSPSPSQRSPPRSVAKPQRKQSERHFCEHCPPGSFAGFSTINDLARHRKGVHGIYGRGDKVWRCRVDGCTCAEKVWPRQDNFHSHLKRMHFNGDDAKAKAFVETCVEDYDPDIHVSLGPTKPGNTRGGQRSKSSHDLGPPSRPPKRASVPNNSMVPQQFMADTTGQARVVFAQDAGYMDPRAPESLNSMMMSHGTRTTPALSRIHGSGTTAASSLFFQSSQLGSMGRNMVRPGDAVTAPPNPDSRSRQRREMQEQDQAVPHFPNNGPSMEDLSSLGQGLGYGGTVDPSLISTTRSDHRSIDLDTTDGALRPALDPQKILERLLKKLSPEERGMLKKLPPETREKFFKKVEQDEESDDDQDHPTRSVQKPPTKKKTDGEKTLKCDHLVEKKGDKDKTLVPCLASFNSPSELRKHRKRHFKRFGCTFDGCYSRFGTKWEWKRHEQSQHIQNEAWRCRQENGETTCQKLFSDQKEFEKHLTDKHFHKSATAAIAKEVDECHLLKKWLGSYWCGYCPRIVRSEKDYGRDMDDERVEHIGNHVLKGSKSSDWVELAGEGKTKGEMKEIADRGGEMESQSSRVESREQSSRQETEGEEDEDDEGHDSDGSETADLEESNSPAELQQPRPKLPTLDVFTAQNSSVPPSSLGSRTEPQPTTPSIQVQTPEGLVMADPMVENVNTRPMQQQRAHTDNNIAGYRNQRQHQHLQPQLQSYSQSQPQPQQIHNVSRLCCGCRRPLWGIYEDRCDYCQHECGSFCTFQGSQGNFVTGTFPNNDESGFGYYEM